MQGTVDIIPVDRPAPTAYDHDNLMTTAYQFSLVNVCRHLVGTIIVDLTKLTVEDRR